MKVVFWALFIFGLVGARRVSASPEAGTASLALADIGPVAQAGELARQTNGYRLTTHGTSLAGVADLGSFAYQERTGDFDVRVRILALEGTEVWNKAGLMARESLAPDSRYAAVITTPTLGGSYFQARAATSSAATNSGSFPVNYPFHWLRLQRQGDILAGYASWDGQTWHPLGQAFIRLPSPVQLGLVGAGTGADVPLSVVFCDYGDAPDPQRATAPLSREALGPSSRKTGLVISEIMHHPPASLGDKRGEFVEVFNSNPFPESLAGCRLAGDIQYTFPPGSFIPGGGYLVVAREPADLPAAYGVTNVVGPFTGTLKSSGLIQLRGERGSVLLEVPYASGPPWPAGADGTGHSLVLVRPSLGEANPLAWSVSGRKGGSPGVNDTRCEDPLSRVCLNEFLANTDAPTADFIELYNHSREAVDISGCYLSDDPATNKFRVPAGTVVAPGGYAVFDETELGFALRAAGETILFSSPDPSRILDAVTFPAQAVGRASGRSPDGAAGISPLAQPTPGAPNADRQISDIVINEIMYHPISDDDDEEYVELFNQSGAAVDLGGWKFVAGIEFEFPSGTRIAAGGYLVVARNVARLRSQYAQLDLNNSIGDYQGRLSDRGERLALARPEGSMDPSTQKTNLCYAVLDEVTYGTGGRWGRWADGGGSSLELIQPSSHHDLAANWADSDESRKADWTLVEATGVLDQGLGNLDALHVLLLEAGECLVDKVEVLAANNPTNLVANSDFESGLAGWVVQGDHLRSSLEITEGFQSAQSLHVRASNQGDTGVNRIRVPLTRPTALPAGQVATLRARVRWLCGWPEVLLRLKGNYLEAFGRLALPKNLGTPGQRNSRALANAGPAIYEVAHYPVLPAAAQDVRVTARIHDPDRIATVRLQYRLDPGTNWAAVAMTDDGHSGDRVASDGIWTAMLPGQPAGTLVAFHLQAADAAAAPATAGFPADAPVHECLVRFGEPIPASSFGTYRLWLTSAAVNAWRNRPVLSNEDLEGTFVYGQDRAIYNLGARYTGSPWHQSAYTSPTGAPCSYALRFPKDDQLLGTDSFNKLHAPGNTPGDDPTIQKEQTAYRMVRQLGLPWNYQRYVNVYFNGVRRGSLLEDTQVPNGDVVAEHFPDDAEGDLFKLNGWYEFDSSLGTTPGFQLASWCTLNDYPTTGGQKKVARYRWNWAPRAMHGTANSYTNLFRLIDAIATGNNSSLSGNLEPEADMDQWLRTFAIEHAVGNWDSFGNRNAQNMFAYKPTRGRWQLLIWDFNIVLGNSGSDGPTGDDLFQFNYADAGMRKIYNHPAFARAYLRHLQEIAAGPLAAEKLDPLVDARYAAFKANGLNVSAPASIKSYARSRQTYLQRYLTNFAMEFTLTRPLTLETNTPQNWITLEGTAPLAVTSVQVNGVAYPLTWTSLVTWQTRVPLPAVTNVLFIESYDRQGELLRDAVASRTIITTAPAVSPRDQVVINEILYHPARAGTEFIELFNASDTHLFDLTHYRLEGVDFDFPEGQLIGPREYLLVVRDRAAFQAAYGAGLPIAGVYPGTLRAAGETLRLVRRDAAAGQPEVMDEITYQATLPWPVVADGTGASLQLQNPAGDRNQPANWAAISPEEASRPEWKFVSVTGPGAGDRLLVYHSPAQVAPDPLDISGQWDGQIGFTGEAYQMSVRFERNATNGWSGQFLGQDTQAPLGSVRLSGTNITFAFPAEYGSIQWQGKLNPNDQTIAGTFTQVVPGAGSVSAPFSLKRFVDPKLRWGGEVYLDDLQLVAGTVPAQGPNLVGNGDFEQPLASTWNLSPNHQDSRVSASPVHQGSGSLRLIASLGGADTDTAVWQSVGPLDRNQVYTLSYWFLPTTNGNDLTVRLNQGGLGAQHSLAPDQPATPGRPNTLLPLWPTRPQVYLSEVVPNNLNGITDQLGHRGPWIELVNLSPQPLSLAGYSLSDRADTPGRWAFPDDAVLAPGQYRMVWLDGAADENTLAEWHADFPLATGPGTVWLNRMQGEGFEMVDALTYATVPADFAYGSIPGSLPAIHRELLPQPSPGQANQWTSHPPGVVINEWMANNKDCFEDPDLGNYADWFELYNPGTHPIDLGGFALTDDLADANQWLIPSGTQLNPGGFLVVWADERTDLNGKGQALHAGFKLNQGGEAIGLFDRQGQLVDVIIFGNQTPNVSEGRWPDGAGNTTAAMGKPTPGTANVPVAAAHPEVVISEVLIDTDRRLLLQWVSEWNAVYQVQFKETLDNPIWMDLGPPVTASTSQSRYVDDAPAARSQRFYRVIRVGQ